MKVEMAVLGSPSLISLMVSVDVKHHERDSSPLSELRNCVKASRGGCPGLPVPNSPYGICRCEATLNTNSHELNTNSPNGGTSPANGILWLCRVTPAWTIIHSSNYPL